MQPPSARTLSAAQARRRRAFAAIVAGYWCMASAAYHGLLICMARHSQEMIAFDQIGANNSGLLASGQLGQGIGRCSRPAPEFHCSIDIDTTYIITATTMASRACRASPPSRLLGMPRASKGRDDYFPSPTPLLKHADGITSAIRCHAAAQPSRAATRL